MRKFSRVVDRLVGCSRQTRNFSLSREPSTSKHPRQIGGVHFQEGDRVLAIHKDGRRVIIRLTEPLQQDGKTRLGRSNSEIDHNAIIGKQGSRLFVDAPSPSTKIASTTFRVQHPSLDQFISLAPRSVTPIYSSYGSTIIDLLDIHVGPPIPSNDPQTSSIPRFEILEAGTGNGALTLHLAKTIAAANPVPPCIEDSLDEDALEKGWDEWRAQRRAIVHTVEYLEPRSRATEGLIKSFRGALYWPHIDFHSGDVGAWVQSEHNRRKEIGRASDGYLDVVILDLPSVHDQIVRLVEAMKEGGQLAVWVPQITQIAACQQQIDHHRLPMKLDAAVELGEGISNGRRWDVRFVKTRAEQKKESTQSEKERSEETEDFEPSDIESNGNSSSSTEATSTSEIGFPTMVCRPLVGQLTQGGGFVGIWRKVSQVKAQVEES